MPSTVVLPPVKKEWKKDTFEALGKTLVLAENAAKPVAAVSKEEAASIRAVRDEAQQRLTQANEKLKSTAEGLVPAKEAKEKSLKALAAARAGKSAEVEAREQQLEAVSLPVGRLNFQSRADQEVINRLTAEAEALRIRQEAAEKRSGELAKAVSDARIAEQYADELRNRIREEESRPQANVLLKDKGLADEIKSDKESLKRTEAEMKDAQDRLGTLLDGADIAQEKLALEAVSKSWDGKQLAAYKELQSKSKDQRQTGLEKEAQCKVIDGDIELHRDLAAKQKAFDEAKRKSDNAKLLEEDARKKLGRFIRTDAEKENLNEAMKTALAAAHVMENAQSELESAKKKVDQNSDILPESNLRTLKNQADIEKATAEKEAAETSRKMAAIAEEEAVRLRTAAQDKLKAVAGAELVKKVSETAKARDEALAKVNEAKAMQDLLKTVAAEPGDPAEALKKAGEIRDKAEKERQAAEAEIKKAEAALKTAAPGDKGVIETYIKDLQQEMDAHKEEFTIAKAAFEQRKAANEKLEAAGVMEVKKEIAPIEKKIADLEASLSQFKADLLKYQGVADSKNKALFGKGETLKTVNEKVESLTRSVESLETTIKGKQDELAKKQKTLDEKVSLSVKTENESLTAAVKEAKEQDVKAEAASEEMDKKIAGNPDLQDALATADTVEQRALNEKQLALISIDAANKDLEVAKFQDEVTKSHAKYKDVFAKFDILTDASYDEHDEQGSGWVKELNKMSVMPDPNDPKKQIPNPNFDKDITAAQHAYVELIEQDQIMEDMGASFEQRQQAFASVPKALWPLKFREEVKAYREVELLVAQEKVEEEAKQRAKKQIETKLGKLGAAYKDVYKRLSPILDVVFDSVSAVGDIRGIGKEKEAPDQLSIMKDMTSAMVTYFSENISAVKELAGEDKKDGEEEDVEEKDENEESLKILEFLKEACKSQLSLVNSAVTAVGGEIPGLDVVLGAIETAEAVYTAGKATKLAYNERQIQSGVKGGDDEIMKKAFDNQTGASTRKAVKDSIDAAASGIQLGGSIATVSGAAAPVGVGLKVGGKALAYGNKVAFQCIDWKKAATAKNTLDKAKNGSIDAMQQVFADHQMYATSYIVLRARDGDAMAMKMCLGRSVDQGKLLDEAVSVKLIRKFLLEQVGQKDQMETIGESAKNTGKAIKEAATLTGQVAAGGAVAVWDKLCKTGKLIKVKVVGEDLPSEAGAQKPGKKKEAQAEEAEVKPSKDIPTAKQIADIQEQAKALFARYQKEPLSYVEKDCGFRALSLSSTKAVLEAPKGKVDEALVNQAKDLELLLSSLPKKPFVRTLRPAKKTPTLAEEMLRRTR